LVKLQVEGIKRYVINSPTEDAELRQQVRTIWSSKDSRRRLFDSLLLDYATQGNWKEGDSFGEWYVGSNLQIAAAMRLLYYFPKETVPMIIQRLQALRVERTGPGAGSRATDKEMEAWSRREVANSARTDEFVKAISWCKDPAVRRAVRSVFERTGDVDILLAALPGINEADGDLIRSRIETFLDQVPKEEGGAYGDGYNLLVALDRRVPKSAKVAFQLYLRDARAQRCHTVCEVLKETKPAWAIELLRPLLRDKRPVGGYSHPVSNADSNASLPIRVCDAAAETLSKNESKLKFSIVGTNEDLDRQIQVIQQELEQTNK